MNILSQEILKGLNDKRLLTLYKKIRRVAKCMCFKYEDKCTCDQRQYDQRAYVQRVKDELETRKHIERK